MTNLTITTLKKNPELLKDTLNLIEKSFQYGEASTFATDFYSLINKENHHHCYLLLKDGNLIGHIGLKKKIFIHESYESPIAFLGGISILESERGYGYFQYLMNEILKLHHQDFSMFMLWSDKAELYEKFGFHLSIGQIAVTGLGNRHQLHKTKYHSLNHDEKEQIKSLYKESILKQYFSIKRDENDWEEVEYITSTDLFIKKDGKKIIAYCFKNKGKDLTGIAHELAVAEEKDLKDFIQSTDLTFWLPEKHIEHFPEAQMLFGSLVKIGGSDLFRDFIEHWSEGEIQITRITKEDVAFLFEDAVFTLTHKEFLCALFGPYPLKEFTEFNKFLFISGLDSI